VESPLAIGYCDVPLTTFSTWDATLPSTTTVNWFGLPSIRRVADVP
jgi:hypothetical protein